MIQMRLRDNHSAPMYMPMLMCSLPFMGAGRAEARSEAPPAR